MRRDTKLIGGDVLIECRIDEFYTFRTYSPQRIGDIAEITVGRGSFGKPARIVRVIWLEADDGTRWLVEIPLPRRHKGPRRK